MFEGILGLFLYFPEDKREYIPAAISFLIFFIGAIATWRLFIKSSRREAKRLEELEKDLVKRSKNQ
ncbi:MAG: hypothetical protein ACI35O_11670 [Bacillaceae bacterium]